MSKKQTERERKILIAGRKILNEQGVVDFSMSDIARESGYSRAGVYQLYPTKNTMLSALCFTEMMENIDAIDKGELQAITGDFSFVLRPMFSDYLKLQDKLALDHMLDAYMKSIEKLPAGIPAFDALKSGYQFLQEERARANA